MHYKARQAPVLYTMAFIDVSTNEKGTNPFGGTPYTWGFFCNSRTSSMVSKIASIHPDVKLINDFDPKSITAQDEIVYWNVHHASAPIGPLSSLTKAVIDANVKDRTKPCGFWSWLNRVPTSVFIEKITDADNHNKTLAGKDAPECPGCFIISLQ